MKRKIQRDAVNNQEDEDSSAYPIRFPVDAIPDEKGKKADEDNTISFFSEATNNKDESTGGRKYL